MRENASILFENQNSVLINILPQEGRDSEGNMRPEVVGL